MADKLYDGIMFIGQHAMAGAKDGVLAHSQSFNVKRIAINGREVGEIGQVAAIAGHFGIPVIMLAGDQAACDEINRASAERRNCRGQATGGKGVDAQPLACRSDAADRGGGAESRHTNRRVPAVEDRRTG